MLTSFRFLHVEQISQQLRPTRKDWAERVELDDYQLTIVHLKLSTGEHLPCLVQARTWLPLKLATRWAVCYRRQHVQASTLANNLFAIGKLYTWAWQVGGFELEERLRQGILPNAQELTALVDSLRREGQPKRGEAVISPNTVNKYLIAIEDFLTWSLGEARPVLPLERRQALAWQLEAICRSLRYRSHPTRRMKPLSETETKALRKILTPQRNENGVWQFPDNGFTPTNALRNWLMVEMALELGLRLGELLKLRLDSLPRGGQAALLVRRYPDDPYDSRRHEPAVKTAERGLPVSPALLAALRFYLTAPPPLGRTSGKSPYLFVTDEGQPLSLGRAQDIIHILGERSGVKGLSWHRLRHTWAERLAVHLLDVPNGLDQLMYLGGWTHSQSPLRYIQEAVAQQAQTTLRAWQSSLYLHDESDDR